MVLSEQNQGVEWRAARPEDLAVINQIADEVHVDLPERPEVFAEKLNLFRDGCFVLMQNDAVVGYGFSHPWLLYTIPPLDTFLAELSPSPECVFIHDVVVLPRARGQGAAEKLVEMIANVARRHHIPNLALVSVYDTHPLWKRCGFEVVADPALRQKLRSYGETARYMMRKLS